QRAGLARVLDAPIALQPKIALARAVGEEVGNVADRQLPDLDAAFARVDVPAADRVAAARLHAGLRDELDRAATSAFSRSFLAGALLALLAAGAVAVALLRPRSRISGAAASTNGSRLRPAPALHVALPAACTAATALVAAYVVLGGASYGPTPVADPCAARARPAVERTQLVVLATLDGAACRLRTSREELLLALLARERPPGTSDAELADALVDGIDRAQREGALGAVAATGLRLAIRTGGALGVVGLLIAR
ncbi:MAG: hypothetical protein QOJ35_2193, partial [Solirubrobacteraceae bacterium]|nr:hypothetical protein [Solirubrobacteraceae bacterium]